MTHLLIDGDILAYRSATFNEVATEVEPGYWTWHCEFDKVITDIKGTLEFFVKRLDAKEFTICLSDEVNFRKTISDTYKENRVKYKRPLVLKPVREYLFENYSVGFLPTLEADDVMGILHTDPNFVKEGTVIVSMDKDMKTIPGKIYRNEEEGLLNISKEEADYNHLFQTLIGDTIDGYSGCPSIGKVTAKKILDKDPTWASVVKTFESKGLTEEDALVQARLARILRLEDYDYEEQKPILWNPN